MKARGLRVISTGGEFLIPPGRMTDDLAEIGPVDVVLFCVKSYDTVSAAQQLAPLLTEETIIISLQNGVDNEEKIQQSIPRGMVFGGVAYIYSTISAPGVISETGGPKKVVFGPLARREAGALGGKHILDLMLAAGIDATLTDDIPAALWRKFIFISAVGGLTALTRLTLGEILAVEASRSLLADAMRETLSVARVRGIDIEDDYIGTLFEALKKFDNNSRSSLYYDLTHDKPMEIEALSGTVVRYGTQHGVTTPIHATIYASLLPYHLKRAQP
jgi:2-dehydropantoate 2-reductase